MDLHLNLGVKLAVVASLILSATTAYAEQVQQEGGLEEVMVTAQRREESAMKIPLSVTAFSQADLGSQRIENSSDMVGMVPTLQVNSAFGAVQPNFSLRGIGLTNEHNPNQASPVGVYIDDAYISARVSQGLQLFDLDRVEILRGPQGTLYGRNTTGGAINFISHLPEMHGTSGNYQVGYGSFSTFTAAGAFDTALQDGVSGIRLAFNYSHGDGFMRNISPSQPAANSTDAAAVRLIYRVKPSDRFEAVFKLTGGNSNPTQAGVYDLGALANGTGVDPTGNNSTLNYNRQARGLDFWQIDSPRLGYNKVKNTGAELTLKFKLSDVLDLMTLTSYDYADAVFTQEGTGVNSPALKQPLDTFYGNKFTMLNQEIRLAYTSDRTKVQTGLYYGYDKDESDSYYWLFDGAADIHQYFNQTRKSTAVFGQLDQKLTSKLSATLGLRYTMDKATYGNYYSYIEPGNISFTGQRDISPQYWDPSQGIYFLGSSYNATTHSIVNGPAYHLDNNAVTGRAALNYTFDNGQILYASYNRGYRNAAFCGQCFTNTTLDTTKPETNDAWEIGTKGRFLNNRLSITADVFSIDYRNQQTNQQVGLQSLLTNVPKSSMKGVEFEAVAQATPDLRLALSLGYLDATYDELTLGLASVNGAKQPYAPKTTANVHFDWSFAKAAGGTFTLSPTAIYASEVFFSPYNKEAGNGPLSQGANTKINAQVSYQNDSFTAALWTKNLTNQKTFGDGLDLRTFGFYYMIPLAPRTFGLSFGYKF